MRVRKPWALTIKQFHYDQSLVTNANGGGLQEVEQINLQWKPLRGYMTRTSPSEVGLYLVHMNLDHHSTLGPCSAAAY
jgi:hypothetical protein